MLKSIRRISSRSTWACELKFSTVHQFQSKIKSRSTWACELKYAINTLFYSYSMSRSTWACELKFCLYCPILNLICHAPRERVSWNERRYLFYQRWAASRSTWACELKFCIFVYCQYFILSRSTWACELKCFLCIFSEQNFSGHAPRERVSWNTTYSTHEPLTTVTLHVSVWVEI